MTPSNQHMVLATHGSLPPWGLADRPCGPTLAPSHRTRQAIMRCYVHTHLLSAAKAPPVVRPPNTTRLDRHFLSPCAYPLNPSPISLPTHSTLEMQRLLLTLLAATPLALGHGIFPALTRGQPVCKKSFLEDRINCAYEKDYDPETGDFADPTNCDSSKYVDGFEECRGGFWYEANYVSAVEKGGLRCSV